MNAEDLLAQSTMCLDTYQEQLADPYEHRYLACLMDEAKVYAMQSIAESLISIAARLHSIDRAPNVG
jgi:polysaccharide pyruvyl transferase WcaK-like protein